jgi:hypothetical protein
VSALAAFEARENLDGSAIWNLLILKSEAAAWVKEIQPVA